MNTLVFRNQMFSCTYNATEMGSIKGIFSWMNKWRSVSTQTQWSQKESTEIRGLLCHCRDCHRVRNHKKKTYFLAMFWCLSCQGGCLFFVSFGILAFWLYLHVFGKIYFLYPSLIFYGKFIRKSWELLNYCTLFESKNCWKNSTSENTWNI